MRLKIKSIALLGFTALALTAALVFSWRWGRSALENASENSMEQTRTTEPAVTLPPQTVPTELPTMQPTEAETTLPPEPETTAETIPEETEPPRITIDTVPQYYQTDYPDIRYGTGTIATTGSNVTALAMVASFMTDHAYYPDEIADWMVQVTGSSYKRLESVSDLLQLSWYRAANVNIALNAVREGKVAIFLMGSRSLFPGGGHYIVVTGVNEDGKFRVLDPDPENYSVWNLADSFENGFSDGKLIGGFEGGWVYDKSEMPEEPFIYVPEAPPEESRYPGLELTQTEVDLMARLICAEGESEPFEGQQAIAEVILNRLVSGHFQNSINSIIYAEDQFAGADQMYLANPTDTQYKAVERALNGPYVLPIDVVFYAKFKVNDRLWGKIGDHYFCYSYYS